MDSCYGIYKGKLSELNILYAMATTIPTTVLIRERFFLYSKVFLDVIQGRTRHSRFEEQTGSFCSISDIISYYREAICLVTISNTFNYCINVVFLFKSWFSPYSLKIFVFRKLFVFQLFSAFLNLSTIFLLWKMMSSMKID